MCKFTIFSIMMENSVDIKLNFAGKYINIYNDWNYHLHHD